MKKFLHITILLILISAVRIQAQGFVLTSINQTNVQMNSCDTLVTMNFGALNQPASPADLVYVLQGANFTTAPLAVTVNWGDGNITTHSGTASIVGQDIAFNPPVSHSYVFPGYYTIQVDVMNTMNSSSVSNTVSNYAVGYAAPVLYMFASLDCDTNGVVDSTVANGLPVILSDGLVTTTATSQNGLVQFPLTVAGSYTVSIDQNYLNTNGWVVNSILPPGLLNVGCNQNIQTMVCSLQCAPQTIQTCVEGYIFCDNDSNGVLSTGDIPLVNAPIMVQSAGGNLTFYSDSSGFYSATSTAAPGSSAVVMISTQWMTTAGVFIPNYINTIMLQDCSSPNVINFPSQCNLPQPNCYTGVVFCDMNSNGILDGNESPIPCAPVILGQAPGPQITTFTDGSGYFTYCGTIFTNGVTTATLNSWWMQQFGYSGSPVVTIQSNTQGGDTAFIALNCTPVQNGGCANLWTTVLPWIGYYQNNQATIRLNWGNDGPAAPGNYTLTLTVPSNVTVITSSFMNQNYTVNGNTYTWNLNSNSTNFSQTDFIYLNLPGGLINGDFHFYTATIAPSGSVTDCSTNDNAATLLQILGNAYDPNDKTVYAEPVINGMVKEDLTYLIRFQNTGTAPAQNVYIQDTLSSLLDFSTLQILETSHPMQIIQSSPGVIRFDFPNIWLPDSTTNEPESHGYVIYKIRESDAAYGDNLIQNTAYIYFDWNPPIITNTTVTENVALSVDNQQKNTDITLYPNPVGEFLNIKGDNLLRYEITDISGRIIQTGLLQGSVINTSSLSSGIYQIKITTTQGTKVLRFVHK